MFLGWLDISVLDTNSKAKLVKMPDSPTYDGPSWVYYKEYVCSHTPAEAFKLFLQTPIYCKYLANNPRMSVGRRIFEEAKPSCVVKSSIRICVDLVNTQVGFFCAAIKRVFIKIGMQKKACDCVFCFPQSLAKFKATFKSPTSVFKSLCCPAFERTEMSLGNNGVVGSTSLNPAEVVLAKQAANIDAQTRKYQSQSQEWF